jgi:hypothetical protein
VHTQLRVNVGMLQVSTDLCICLQKPIFTFATVLTSVLMSVYTKTMKLCRATYIKRHKLGKKTYRCRATSHHIKRHNFIVVCKYPLTL